MVCGLCDNRAAGQAAYRVVDLGEWVEDGRSRAFGINDNGEIVGEAEADFNDWRAFVWLPSASSLYSGFSFTAGLNELAGSGTVARDINGFGQIVGSHGSPSTAFLWLAESFAGLPAGLNDLGQLQTGHPAEGLGISDTIDPLRVVGHGDVQSPGWTPGRRAWMWTSSVQSLSLLSQPGAWTSPNDGATAFDVVEFDSDVIVAGFAGDHSGAAAPESNDAVAWVSASPNTLGEVQSTDRWAEARDVSEGTGRVVGLSQRAVGETLRFHAATWATAEDGAPAEDLHDGLLPGTQESAAYAIRDDGEEIVGANTSASRALRWRPVSPSGWEVVDLNCLIRDPAWTLKTAQDVSDAGWIVGHGLRNGVQDRAFVLIPVSSACVADLTGADYVPDGAVDVQDLLVLLANWGTCDTTCPTCDGDLDDSGAVAVSDLLTMLALWATARRRPKRFRRRCRIASTRSGTATRWRWKRASRR